MKRLQNPFSFYDFLGYLIPGFFSIYLVLLLISPSEVSWNQVIDHYDLAKIETVFPIIVISYIKGHLLSFISSVTVENYSVWSLGYPSKYLLRISKKGYWHSVNYEDIGKFEYFMRICVRAVMGLILFPIVFFDVILERLIKIRFLFARQLDNYTNEVIRNSIGKKFGTFVDLSKKKDFGDVRENDFFRVIYHYTLERAERHQNKFQNYIALYGFMRTLTLIFVLTFWALIYFNFGDLSYILLLFVSILSFISYMAYNKFSRRFSLEIFMAFVAIQLKDDPEDSYYNESHSLYRFESWINS